MTKLILQISSIFLMSVFLLDSSPEIDIKFWISKCNETDVAKMLEWQFVVGDCLPVHNLHVLRTFVHNTSYRIAFATIYYSLHESQQNFHSETTSDERKNNQYVNRQTNEIV